MKVNWLMKSMGVFIITIKKGINNQSIKTIFMGLFDFIKKKDINYDSITQDEIKTLDHPKYLDDLISIIKSKNSDENRKWAVFEIGCFVRYKKIGDQIIEKIIRSFSEIFQQEKSGEVRWEIIIVLKDLHRVDQRITQTARSGILDSHWAVRANALGYLIKTGDNGLIREALDNLKNEKDESVISSIHKAREKLGNPLTIDEKIDIIKDNSVSENTRLAHLEELRNYKDPKAMLFLIHCLKRDPAMNFYAPGVAAMALMTLNDPNSVPYLSEIIKNATISPQGVSAVSPEVIHAVDVLGTVGDASVIPLIEDLRTRIISRGIESEYVRTEYAAGMTSTNNQIRYFDSAIARLKKNKLNSG